MIIDHKTPPAVDLSLYAALPTSTWCGLDGESRRTGKLRRSKNENIASHHRKKAHRKGYHVQYGVHSRDEGSLQVFRNSDGKIGERFLHSA